MSTSVSAVYLNVVDAVVSKLREEFINEGVDDSVLSELQQLWEMKMLHCGAIQGPIERNSAPRAPIPTPVHDLNVPYEGPEEYETPTAEMLFPPTPLQTPMQTPLPMDTPGYQYYPSGSSEYAGTPDVGAAADMKQGRPSPYTPQPSPWTNQRPLGVDVNVAYEEAREEEGGGGGAGGSGSSNTNREGGVTQASQPPMTDFFMMTSGKRKRDEYASHLLPGGYIPQQDGADIVGCEKVSAGVSILSRQSPRTLFDHLKFQDRESADAEIALVITNKQSTIPQQDGFPDANDDGVSNEGYNSNTPAYCDSLASHIAGTPQIAKSEALEDDEPPLNEDDDDDDLDDLEQGDDEPSTNHLVLAQFEKVSRTKSKWKCTLKDGVMHLNSKDILFTKANGEFDF